MWLTVTDREDAVSYRSNVIKVMIASPNDVETERRIARDVILEWNYVNSEDKALVLMPVSWETHSSPSIEDRPQEIVNKQILKNSDLLIAIFWTRIGTPTGEFASGTVEEIMEHIEAGKPAMVYFSSAPVVPDSIDDEQYSELKKFLADLRGKGLVESFESVSDFKDKLTRQLAHTVIREYSGAANEIQESEFVETPRREVSLSESASDLLITAAQADGQIMALRSMDGLTLQAGGRSFIKQATPRVEAEWIRVIQELENENFIRDRGARRGEFFEVTAEGYAIADALLLES